MNFSEFKELVIAKAQAMGIADYELYYETGADTSIGVFGHEINEFSASEGGGVCFRCIVGGKMGYASTESLNESEARAIVARAVDNASVLESEEAVFLCEGGKTYAPLQAVSYELPSTEELIRTVLEYQGEKCGLIGTNENRIGSKVIPSVRTTPESYDLIVTGDLGQLGKDVLLTMAQREGLQIGGKLTDCGTLIFDLMKQDVHAGGSGCGCSAVTLSAYILKQLEEGIWKKVLFMPTGALLSKTSFNEGQSVPGVAHALVIEHV